MEWFVVEKLAWYVSSPPVTVPYICAQMDMHNAFILDCKLRIKFRA